MSTLPPCDHDECPPTECLRQRISQLEAVVEKCEGAIGTLLALERPFVGISTLADKAVHLGDQALAAIRELKEKS